MESFPPRVRRRVERDIKKAEKDLAAGRFVSMDELGAEWDYLTASQHWAARFYRNHQWQGQHRWNRWLYRLALRLDPSWTGRKRP